MVCVYACVCGNQIAVHFGVVCGCLWFSGTIEEQMKIPNGKIENFACFGVSFPQEVNF
jgi:hypothetical protein